MKMKLNFSLLLILSIVISQHTFGQERTTDEETPDVKIESSTLHANDVLIDIYYGGPYLQKWFAEATEDISDNSNKSEEIYSSIGPTGLRAEFLAGKRFGLGVNIMYSSYKVRYKELTNEYDSISNSYSQTNYKVEEQYHRLRVIFNANLHFNVAHPQWDVYITGGVGFTKLYGSRIVNSIKNGPNQTEGEDYGDLQAFPISGRVAFGAHYFFSDHIGLNFETGIGGPVFCGGLSFHF